LAKSQALRGAGLNHAREHDDQNDHHKPFEHRPPQAKMPD
jgi:hypothetical protein